MVDIEDEETKANKDSTSVDNKSSTWHKNRKRKEQRSTIQDQKKYLDYLHAGELVVRREKKPWKPMISGKIIKPYLAEIENSQTDNSHLLWSCQWITLVDHSDEFLHLPSDIPNESHFSLAPPSTQQDRGSHCVQQSQYWPSWRMEGRTTMKKNGHEKKRFFKIELSKLSTFKILKNKKL